MPSVRIYQPAKTAMQSGRHGTARWLLEYAPGAAQRRDPLMGWSGSTDTRAQLSMRFASREEAVAYAERNGLDYEVMEPRRRTVRPTNYADNFAPGRGSNWTH